MQPKHHENAERAVIGYLISFPKEVGSNIVNIKREYFYFEIHQMIFDAIIELYRNGEAIDIISLSDCLDKKKQLEKVGGSAELAKLINECYTVGTSQITYHCGILKEKYEERKLWELLQGNLDKLENKKYNGIKELISTVSKELFDVTSDTPVEKTDISDIINSFSKRQEDFTFAQAEGKQYIGIPSKYKAIDKLIDGYREEHMWVVSAFTSVGKSSFMLNLVHRLLEQDKRVCIFSLEMSKEDMFGKLMAIELSRSPIEILKGNLDSELYPQMQLAKSKFVKKDITMYSELSNVEDILLAMQSEMLKRKVDVFFIDYIQNLSSSFEVNEYHLLTYSIKLLQQANRRMKSTLIVLSQISNDTNKSNETLNVNAKGTGAIKAAADFFVFLKRDGTEEEITEYYNSGKDIPMKCVVNKNRHGKIGTFKLNLKQSTGEMYEPI